MKARISTIAKELAGGMDRLEIQRIYAKKWKISPRSLDRYLYDAKEEASLIANKANEAADVQMAEAAKDLVLNGLKTKTERLFILQKEVDECLKELYDVGTDNFADFGGGRKNVKKQLTVIERTKLRQTIDILQASIGKIMGDFAPVKAASTDPDGKAIPPPTFDEKQFNEIVKLLNATSTG